MKQREPLEAYAKSNTLTLHFFFLWLERLPVEKGHQNRGTLTGATRTTWRMSVCLYTLASGW